MKVILLQDIKKMGKKFDVKEMPNGHALHLIKTGAVEMATPAKLSGLKVKNKANETADKAHETELAGIISGLKDAGITIAAKANDEGGLFEGITAEKIAEAAGVDSAVVELDAPIKELGEHEIVMTNGDKKAKVMLVIISA